MPECNSSRWLSIPVVTSEDGNLEWFPFESWFEMIWFIRIASLRAHQIPCVPFISDEMFQWQLHIAKQWHQTHFWYYDIIGWNSFFCCVSMLFSDPETIKQLRPKTHETQTENWSGINKPSSTHTSCRCQHELRWKHAVGEMLAFGPSLANVFPISKCSPYYVFPTSIGRANICKTYVRYVGRELIKKWSNKQIHSDTGINTMSSVPIPAHVPLN